MAVQLSVAVTLAVKLGTADWQDALAKADWLGAQVTMVGLVLSVTVKLAEQVMKFPAASVTVIVTVVTPIDTSVPAAGDCVITSEGVAVQLSVAVTLAVKSGTEAWHEALAKAD